jgi:hypothetical protein
MSSPSQTAGTARNALASDAKREMFLRRVLARLWRTPSGRDHQAVLSNIDWVIEMLQRVRRDRPAATAKWWESLKRAVPSASDDKHDNEGRE